MQLIPFPLTFAILKGLIDPQRAVFCRVTLFFTTFFFLLDTLSLESLTPAKGATILQ